MLTKNSNILYYLLFIDQCSYQSTSRIPTGSDKHEHVHEILPVCTSKQMDA
jgi:hypothetical protein